MEYRLHGLSRSTEDIVSFLQASCKNLMRLTQLEPRGLVDDLSHMIRSQCSRKDKLSPMDGFESLGGVQDEYDGMP
jgi:hypothetical protein